MTAQTITMSMQEFETLVALARVGAPEGDSARRLSEYLTGIEKNNGITRYSVWVQWQEMDEALPAGTVFPDTWPPQLRWFIELTTRPVSRSDVDAVIAVQARSPVNILVTKDVGARYGWTPLADFFVV